MYTVQNRSNESNQSINQSYVRSRLFSSFWALKSHKSSHSQEKYVTFLSSNTDVEAGPGRIPAEEGNHPVPEEEPDRNRRRRTGALVGHSHVEVVGRIPAVVVRRIHHPAEGEELVHSHLGAGRTEEPVRNHLQVVGEVGWPFRLWCRRTSQCHRALPWRPIDGVFAVSRLLLLSGELQILDIPRALV